MPETILASSSQLQADTQPNLHDLIAAIPSAVNIEHIEFSIQNTATVNQGPDMEAIQAIFGAHDEKFNHLI